MSKWLLSLLVLSVLGLGMMAGKAFRTSRQPVNYKPYEGFTFKLVMPVTVYSLGAYPRPIARLKAGDTIWAYHCVGDTLVIRHVLPSGWEHGGINHRGRIDMFCPKAPRPRFRMNPSSVFYFNYQDERFTVYRELIGNRRSYRASPDIYAVTDCKMGGVKIWFMYNGGPSWGYLAHGHDLICPRQVPKA